MRECSDAVMAGRVVKGSRGKVVGTAACLLHSHCCHVFFTFTLPHVLSRDGYSDVDTN